MDCSNVTLKAMPGLTSVHLQPNNFEKMRVNFAFQLFGDRVITGLQFYKHRLESSWGQIDATLSFFRMMNSLITTMTSRFPAKALRPGSKGVQLMKDFLEFLSQWETHAKGAGGYLSKSTADGLKVTISSTLQLLDYLAAHGYKFVMTSRLSQDPLENFFGIIRESSGCNNHPTPTQFLIVVNCLSFYNLAKVVGSGNAEQAEGSEDLSSLLSAHDVAVPDTSISTLDKFIDSGDLASAERLLHSVPVDHRECIEQKSDSRLVHYMAGYVARKFLSRSNCEKCKSSLLDSSGNKDETCQFTAMCDKGGLLYPSQAVFEAVKRLEDIFTVYFSQEKLCSDSILDVMSLVKLQFGDSIGCAQHEDSLTTELIKFYVLTRLHFYVRGLNQSREDRRKKKLHGKISRCT